MAIRQRSGVQSLHLSLQRHGINLSKVRAESLHAMGFDVRWLPWLIERAQFARKPGAVVATWLRGRGWVSQVLFVAFTKLDLWKDYSKGGRFNLCLKLSNQDFPVPALFASIRAISVVREQIRDPAAYLSRLIRNGQMIRFIEAVEKAEEAAAPIKPLEVVGIVERLTSKMQA